MRTQDEPTTKRRCIERNERGHFVSPKPPHFQAAQLEAQDAHNSRMRQNHYKGTAYFERFSRLFFIKDDTVSTLHWISAQVKGSTLLNVVDELWKRAYLPHVAHRISFFHRMIYNWNHAHFSKSLPIRQIEYIY